MSSVKLGDDYVRVPKLDVGGSNWVLYKERLTWAADAKGLVGHLDGTSAEPVAPPSSAGTNTTAPVGGTATGVAATPTAAGGGVDAAATTGGGTVATAPVGVTPGPGTVPDPAHAAYQLKLAGWKKGEAIVKQLIASTIPDSLFMKVRAKGTAHAIWQALAAEFEKRSRMVSLDLRRRLQEQRCGDKADVRAHFAKLRTIYEDLAAMGHTPEDDDFYAIILGSMPTSYETYISSLTATSTITGHVLTPEQLMGALTDKYDRRALRNKSGRSGGDPNDVALSANDKGKGKSKKNIECFNCKKRGHYKSECWAPGGGKEGQGPKDKSKSKDQGAAASEEKKDEAWYVYTTPEDSDNESLPDLRSFSDSSSEADGLSEDSTDEGDEDIPFACITHCEPYTDAVVDFTSHPGAMLAEEPSARDRTILFDSGATRHMSPHRDLFVNYKTIAPKTIQAADNHTFRGVGRGDMFITVPNGKTTTRILLRDVLHASAMGVTLVSVSRITKAGLSVSFHSGECRVFNPDGKRVATIPLVRGLYRISAPGGETASPAVEGEKTAEGNSSETRAVTLDKAHRMLGHVSYNVACEAITNGLIEGVTLIPGSTPTTCDTCERGKMSRKAISKERVRP